MKRGMRCFLAVLIGLGLISGINAQTRLAPPNDPNLTARAGQSEVIINAGNSSRDIAVWINGNIAAHVSAGSTEKVIVNNGQNTVEAADISLGRNNNWNIGTRRRINVNSNSNSVTIGLTLRYGALVNLNIQRDVALGGAGSAPVVAATSAPARPAAPPPVTGNQDVDSLENAIHRAAWRMSEDLPDDSVVAILSISTADPALAQIIIADMGSFLLSTRRFTLVDRQRLEAIRQEREFQFSGEVDDRTATSIGRMLGANIVITGSVSESGNLRRLVTQALDVESGRVMAIASERY